MSPGAPQRATLTADQHVDGVLAGDRAILARTITLLESSRPDHQALAQAVLTRLLPHTGGAHRVGLTGVPGAGKSTLIEALGTRLLDRGSKVAVLAIDPTSVVTGGSILGDKTRMGRLASDRRAFVRPSPSAGTLGGVASRTREALLVCEAAGYDVVIVETVGTGQSEVAVADLVDTFVVLALAGAGDELQGIKRGVLELGDVLCITKADGANAQPAKVAARQLQVALRLVHARDPSDTWRPPVLTCSSVTGDGLDALWERVTDHAEHRKASGAWDARRRAQQVRWMWSRIDEGLGQALRCAPAVQAILTDTEAAVRAGRLPPSRAARTILDAFLGSAPGPATSPEPPAAAPSEETP